MAGGVLEGSASHGGCGVSAIDTVWSAFLFPRMGGLSPARLCRLSTPLPTERAGGSHWFTAAFRQRAGTTISSQVRHNLFFCTTTCFSHTTVPICD